MCRLCTYKAPSNKGQLPVSPFWPLQPFSAFTRENCLKLVQQRPYQDLFLPHFPWWVLRFFLPSHWPYLHFTGSAVSSDIWSESRGDMARPTKKWKMKNTKTMRKTFREHPGRAILETYHLWGTDHISDNQNNSPNIRSNLQFKSDKWQYFQWFVFNQIDKDWRACFESSFLSRSTGSYAFILGPKIIFVSTAAAIEKMLADTSLSVEIPPRKGSSTKSIFHG